MYGQGGQLGHVTWVIYTNFHSPFLAFVDTFKTLTSKELSYKTLHTIFNIQFKVVLYGGGEGRTWSKHILC